MPMHRSSRLRRFAVAFIVILLIAVAVRFARASAAPTTLRAGSSPVPVWS